MIESTFDVALLFGIDYIIEKFSSSIKEAVTESLYVSNSKFIKKLPVFLYDLEKFIKIEELSSFLTVSTYFFRLINPRKDLHGRCVICDMHLVKIQKHLKHVHSFKTNWFAQYSAIFSKNCYFYMPVEFKNVEESALDKKRRKKIRPTSFYDQRLMLNSSMPTKQTLPEIKNISRIELVNSNSFICTECGKIINKNQKSDHMRNHKRKQMIQCSICLRRMKQRELAAHLKTCECNILET